jgi:hypothetical protein
VVQKCWTAALAWLVHSYDEHASIQHAGSGRTARQGKSVTARSRKDDSEVRSRLVVALVCYGLLIICLSWVSLTRSY